MHAKHYRLLAADGSAFMSSTSGTFGGFRPGRIYGRLDCRTALRSLAQGGYAHGRVFFADEAAAIAAGFRPCGHCLRARYGEWKRGGMPGSKEYPWLLLPQPELRRHPEEIATRVAPTETHRALKGAPTTAK